MDPQADHQQDQELVRAVLRGERPAVDALVRRLACVPRILALLNQRMGVVLGPEDLGDLTQDTLASLWPRMRAYNGQASLESWAYGFCFNGFMNAVRRSRRRRGAEALDEATVPSSARPAVTLEYDQLHRGLARQDEREVRVIRLKYFDGLTFDEIGTRLGISPNTAKTCHYRGIRRLATLLGAEAEEETP
jgi:RNA polymerase sigma-70 factor (ECF subfamily)